MKNSLILLMLAVFILSVATGCATTVEEPPQASEETAKEVDTAQKNSEYYDDLDEALEELDVIDKYGN